MLYDEVTFYYYIWKKSIIRLDMQYYMPYSIITIILYDI